MNAPLAPAARPPVPPLQSGDRLSRDEFERRYEAMPEMKAELIRGVVYVASPVNHDSHGRPHSHVPGWLVNYVAGTPGTDVGDNSSLRLDNDNEPQPDACLMIAPGHGGQALIENGYILRAPELIFEVSASSASYDLHDKLDVYREHGVREYVVWRVYDEGVDWFVLEDGVFHPVAVREDGVYESRVFPGLWLQVKALLAGDIARLLQVLQQGLASPAHAAFVEDLRKRAERSES